MQASRPLDPLEFPLDLHHSFLNQPPVSLDLRFAGSAEKAETAALTLKVRPRPDETRALVGKMRQFDLERPLRGAGPSSEDLEDKPCAIDNFAAKAFFEVALLHGRQRTIHDHQVY